MENKFVQYVFSDHFTIYRNIAAIIGAAYTLRLILNGLWTLGGGFCAYFLAPWGLSRINLKKYGSWAVVTGASEGIGRGYALELARQGLNVAILSRSREKLEKVEEEIKTKYNREVRVIPVDFSQGQTIYEDIQAEISDLDIAVLVNNVGLGLEYPNYFTRVNEMRHRNIIELNCQSMVQMTHLVLPKMVEEKKGIIVNLSSLAGVIPNPLLCVYGATKAFVRHFSTALQTEYKSRGIIVQCVSPGPVDTAMSATAISVDRSASLLAPSPEHYTKTAVATIGVRHHTNACIPHAFQEFITKLSPDWLAQKIYLKFLKDLRIRCQNKLNKNK